MSDRIDFEGFEQRRRERYEEAGRGRLARQLRAAREARETFVEGVRTSGVRVRWGLPGDEAAVARLLDLNGVPRWVAFEERFIVAEREGDVLAAIRYRTEAKRLVLGLLVVEPWAGERRFARALYAGALGLARELGVKEVRARTERGVDYPRSAGYRRLGREWRAEAVEAGEVRLLEECEGAARGFWRRMAGVFGTLTLPFNRAFRG